MLAQNKGDFVLPTRLTVPDPPPSPNAARGAIGVGCWHTLSEYADISVTAPDGRALLTPEQARAADAWTFPGDRWQIQDGAIRPSGADLESVAFVGDRAWTDYTVRLRARKLRGREGFIVAWHAADNDNYFWWNIGGWGNTLARCEATEDGGREAYGPGTRFTVEPNRWYELRLEITSTRARGYIDDTLVTDVTYEPQGKTAPVVATATFDRAERSVIVKVVNAGPTPVATDVHLRGARRVEPTAAALVLSGDPKGDNTLDEPKRIAPRSETLNGIAETFRHTFPPHSLTILRLRAGPDS